MPEGNCGSSQDTRIWGRDMNVKLAEYKAECYPLNLRFLILFKIQDEFYFKFYFLFHFNIVKLRSCRFVSMANIFIRACIFFPVDLYFKIALRSGGSTSEFKTVCPAAATDSKLTVFTMQYVM
jgi:hypothetical protein